MAQCGIALATNPPSEDTALVAVVEVDAAFVAAANLAMVRLRAARYDF